MFRDSTGYYDILYSFKDYKAESALLGDLILARLPAARSLLDVACGTGLHDCFLKQRFQVTGLDLLPDFVTQARDRNPECSYHQGDMRNFQLDGRFDVVCCLFSSIGYMLTVSDLELAVSRMSMHLNPEGLLLIEPWFTPDQWKPETVHCQVAEFADGHICRMARSLLIEGRSVVEFEFLVARPQGFERFSERHELNLFTHQQMEQAYRRAGLDVEFDETGISGRGLWIGRR